ncbi:tetratricopeptide repeat protein [Actinoplanes couchii]|uniref:NB-ARC domain protein n=1 Tax=Actinoplanes couchii TaxID=403638 RepID=A0ABQ3XK61_9ACTN|nr:tetratricopeptide repeat protein [Actinoplanes couchii]MDR6320483.1 tetratricopeptide (TPR) repeat protein [Actinoplanes couchii]GID58887.1 hypothetical protein Aco03nite_072910 [Actinoplanes couchii]
MVRNVAVGLPDPGAATSLDGLAEQLRALKVWAGDPSYRTIRNRVNDVWSAAGRPAAEMAGKTTVVDCFRPGRRRLNTELVLTVVRALHPDRGYLEQWRQALRIVDGRDRAAARVHVQDTLPPDLAEFTGRTAELGRLGRILDDSRRDGGTVVISAIEGMAGVGKTRLAVHVGHTLTAEQPFDRVLFVNLRGFHPDPTQPPADPAAVLDGFLGLLGVPGPEIPHDLAARVALYRRRLTGLRALVVLDDAADAAQVRHLLPHTPGCLVLVTSRRHLAGLPDTTHLTVDVFTAGEARQFLTRATPLIPVGDDPGAVARIAGRCGHLPLALGLMAGHMRAKPGWTMTDHADWLDDRHQDRRLDDGIALALDLSYRHLPLERARLLRLLALHPGHDLDAYAAAALTGTDLATAGDELRQLCDDHLLQQGTPGRFTFHDLVRAYATGRAHDEDRPAARRAALTCLFDHYLTTAATAIDVLHPAEAHLRPAVPPVAAPAPALADPDAARGWLDAERPTLVAVAAHAATHGWPGHATRFSRVLYRYLEGGYHLDAVAVHGHAYRAARDAGDPAEMASAVNNLGVAHRKQSRYELAAECCREALALFRQTGDLTGESRALNNLGTIAVQSGDHQEAVDYYERALTLDRRLGDRANEAIVLANLGNHQGRMGRYEVAAEHLEQALTQLPKGGSPTVEASMLNGLAHVEVQSGRFEPAGEHLRRARELCRQVGDRDGEAYVLDSLGLLEIRLGRHARATAYHQQALVIFQESGDRDGEAWALNGLGEAAHAGGRPSEALDRHAAAHEVAVVIGHREQQARACAGTGRAHRALGDPEPAREQFRRALALYTDLGLSGADEVRLLLAALDEPQEETSPRAGD